MHQRLLEKSVSSSNRPVETFIWNQVLILKGIAWIYLELDKKI